MGRYVKLWAATGSYELCSYEQLWAAMSRMSSYGQVFEEAMGSCKQL